MCGNLKISSSGKKKKKFLSSLPSEINSTELMRLSEWSLLSKADFRRTVYEYLGTKTIT